MRSQSKLMVGVIGGHAHNTSTRAMELAEQAGVLLGQLGATVICGGENGIMEAVCRGCKRAGGVTIGILKSKYKSSSNPYLDYIIPTSLDLAFMNVLVWSSDGILAFDGRYGTLTEIGLALDIGKPLVAVGTHTLLCTKYITSHLFVHYPIYDDGVIPTAVNALLCMIQENDSNMTLPTR